MCGFSVQGLFLFSFSVFGYCGKFCYLPNNESKPQASHIIKLTPTEPVRTSRPEGDTNIPDPIKTLRFKEIIIIL